MIKAEYIRRYKCPVCFVPWDETEEYEQQASMIEEEKVMESKWHTLQEECPEAGTCILVDISGCKIGAFILMEVREGEGLGHIKRWMYYNIHEKVSEWYLTGKCLDI